VEPALEVRAFAVAGRTNLGENRRRQAGLPMGMEAGTKRGARLRAGGELLRGTVLLYGDEARLVAAVRDALRDSPWLPRAGGGLDESATPADVRAVIAAGGEAALCEATALAAGRVPLIFVAARADVAAVAAGLGAAASLSAAQLDQLPSVLHREIAAAAAGGGDRVAVALLAPLAAARVFDEYCDRLALMLGATHVALFAARRGDELVACGTRMPAALPPGAPRLTARDIETMSAAAAGAAAATERQLGVPAGYQRLWTRLTAPGRPHGGHAAHAIQLVARPDEPFTAAEIDAIERLAGIAALALERSHAVDQLRRTDAVKTEFVRTVSHELRTPLNTVIGYSDLLVEEAFGPLGDEQRRILRRVGDRARGLLEVIAATLDLPGVAGGRVSLETRPVSVAALLAEIEADTREWGMRDDLEYTWDVAGDLPTITTDPGKLRVLLKNLIANAVKFTDRGGITVRARGRDGGVELSVEDTGIGIEGEAIHVVFDAFRQANAAATGKYGGVGLGLYIVRRLVAMLGGRLRVESEIGVGSKFHVWLPADPG
jgi:signal transduction histidine kinase